MNKKDVKALGPGIYKLHWKSGGISLAAVGVTSDGKRWMALPLPGLAYGYREGRSAWQIVKDAEKVFPDEEEKYTASFMEIEKYRSKYRVKQLDYGFYKVHWSTGAPSGIVAVIAGYRTCKKFIIGVDSLGNSEPLEDMQVYFERVSRIYFTKNDIDTPQALLAESLELAKAGSYDAATVKANLAALMYRNGSDNERFPVKIALIVKAGNRDAPSARPASVAVEQISPPLKVIKKDKIVSALLSCKKKRELFCIPVGFGLVSQHDFDNYEVVVRLKYLPTGETVTLMAINYRDDKKDSIEITGRDGCSPLDGLNGIHFGYIEKTLPHIIALAITQDQKVKGWIKCRSGLSLNYTQDEAQGRTKRQVLK